MSKIAIIISHVSMISKVREIMGGDVEIIVQDELPLDGELGSIEQLRFVEAGHYEPEPCKAEFYYDDYDEPKPKPPKGKPFIKQARRQSFRQVMRSVNRNR